MSDKVYKRKARPKIYVQAFIFGYDETPEWFTNCKRVCIPQRLIYEKMVKPFLLLPVTIFVETLTVIFG